MKIDDNSYKDIKELYLRSFNLDASIESIKIKYDTSSFGLKNIGYLAIDTEGDLAAYYGAFPMRMVVDKKDYIVAQSGDTMTAPEHRKKGLFTELAKLTYQLAEQCGIQFVFGFPNANSYPGFIKNLDWKFFGCLKSFIFYNKVLPLCELSVKFKFLLPVYKWYCKIKLAKLKLELSPENIKAFEDDSSRGYIKKNIDFFKYKLMNDNIYLIKINDFSLLIKPNPHLYIGAVGNFDIKRTDDFIATLKLLAKKLGCKKTIMNLSENHWLFNYLQKKVEHTDSLPIGYYIINKDLPYEEISYVGADSDTF